jgi:hypothetical protein
VELRLQQLGCANVRKGAHCYCYRVWWSVARVLRCTYRRRSNSEGRLRSRWEERQRAFRLSHLEGEQ